MLEDKLLIWKYNRGEAEVLRRIYEKYKNDMMSAANALLYDRSAAEDAVHEVFARFIKNRGKVRITENLKGFLTACVANHVRNANKARLRQRDIPLEQVGAIADGPEKTAISSERTERLMRALAEVPYEQREVLVLRLQSGLKFKAIAKLQGESVNTVQGRYRYGLDKLRTILENLTE